MNMGRLQIQVGHVQRLFAGLIRSIAHTGNRDSGDSSKNGARVCDFCMRIFYNAPAAAHPGIIFTSARRQPD